MYWRKCEKLRDLKKFCTRDKCQDDKKYCHNFKFEFNQIKLTLFLRVKLLLIIFQCKWFDDDIFVNQNCITRKIRFR